MIDIAMQRKNMVESQVRPGDVTDRRILRALYEIPREEFVPPALRSMAYMDDELRLAASKGGEPVRALMAPRVLAKLVQLADLSPTDAVLDVGCATGYSAAVLAAIAGRVVVLERDAGLAAEAERNCRALSLSNVTVVTGDLAEGHAAGGPYDAIVLEGAVPEVPGRLLEQLKDGGRLAAVVINGGVGQAVLWRREGAAVASTTSFDAGAPLLPGFERATEFVF